AGAVGSSPRRAGRTDVVISVNVTVPPSAAVWLVADPQSTQFRKSDLSRQSAGEARGTPEQSRSICQSGRSVAKMTGHHARATGGAARRRVNARRPRGTRG